MLINYNFSNIMVDRQIEKFLIQKLNNRKNISNKEKILFTIKIKNSNLQVLS